MSSGASLVAIGVLAEILSRIDTLRTQCFASAKAVTPTTLATLLSLERAAAAAVVPASSTSAPTAFGPMPPLGGEAVQLLSAVTAAAGALRDRHTAVALASNNSALLDKLLAAPALVGTETPRAGAPASTAPATSSASSAGGKSSTLPVTSSTGTSGTSAATAETARSASNAATRGVSLAHAPVNVAASAAESKTKQPRTGAGTGTGVVTGTAKARSKSLSDRVPSTHTSVNAAKPTKSATPAAAGGDISAPLHPAVLR